MSQSETGIPHKPEKVKHMAKFKLGDKVKVVKSNRPGRRDDLNAVGMIAYADGTGDEVRYTVDFGEEKSFTWKCINRKKSGRIYYESNLEFLNESPNWKVVILPDGDKTTALYYENGKVVKTEEVKRYFKDEYSVMNAVEAVTNKLFNNGFNWDGFMKTEFAVRFHKESDYDNFLKQCHERGIVWGSEQDAITGRVPYLDNMTIHCGLFQSKQITWGTTTSNEYFSVPVVEWSYENKVEKPEPKFKPGDFVEVVEGFGDCPAGYVVM